MINSLKYAKKLEETGVSREQAEAHIQIITELMENSLATSQDMRELKTELKQEIMQIEQKILLLEHKMTIKLGTIVSIAIGVAVTVSKLVS